MPQLVLGPFVRYADASSAVVWVETDRPCTVSVLDASSPTFTVHGRHYALVELQGLEPGSSVPYTVRLDDEVVWPERDDQFPPSRIRTVDPSAAPRIVFGSCRSTAPHGLKHVLSFGVDVLRAYACHLAASDEDEWPTLLLLLGDQVYADEPPAEVKEFVRGRRDTREEPGEEITDFTEYAELYRLAWSDPAIRWLMSTVPTAMIFDDHDLRDDWNTSYRWRQEMGNRPWWRRKVESGLGAYWIYQHCGNLSPGERASDPLLGALRGTNGDAGGVLDEFAWNADQDPRSYRWSFARDFGRARLVVLDSRCARMLRPDQRSMLDDREAAWLDQMMTGDVDHLAIGSSLPVLLPAGVHYLENWNEAVCDGAWGRRAAELGERVRQGIDLEHWGAFRRSFEDLSGVIAEISSGERGLPPLTVSFLSGDVHYSYLARAELDHASSEVHQIVCSPIRNPLSRLVRTGNVLASFGAAALVGRTLAWAAGVPAAPFRWRIERGPWFHNAVASLDLAGPESRIRWYTARATANGSSQLKRLGEQPLCRRPAQAEHNPAIGNRFRR